MGLELIRKYVNEILPRLARICFTKINYFLDDANFIKTMESPLVYKKNIKQYKHKYVQYPQHAIILSSINIAKIFSLMNSVISTLLLRYSSILS